MRTFRTAESRTLSYDMHGQGPLVVMLPGGPGLDPATFYAGVDLPGTSQTVFCPRGTGESDPPDSPDGYRIAGYVSDVEELRTHLDVPRLTLYGSSHGASTALAYAIAHPQRVERLVLASGPAAMDGGFMQALGPARERYAAQVPDGAERLRAADEATPAMRGATDPEQRRTAMRTVMDTYVAHADPTQAAFLDRLAAADINFAAPGPMGAEMMAGLNLLNNAHHITAPTLVLTGALDVRVPADHMEHVAQAIPGAVLIRFPKSGHLIHVEHPKEWAQTVGPFLRESRHE